MQRNPEPNPPPTQRDARRVVAEAFSRAASDYDAWASVQNAAADRLLEVLDAGFRPRRIVDLGCGTGRTIERLARRYPLATIDGVDCSDAMARHAAARLEGRHAARFHVADAGDFLHGQAEAYDLIVSSFALQWSPNVHDVLRPAAERLALEGVFLLSVPIEGSLEELYRAVRHAGGTSRPFFRSETFWREAIQRAGLAAARVEIATLGASYANGREALASLHRIGAVRALGERESSLNPGQLRRAIRYMEHEAGLAQGSPVTLTYRILWCHARRKKPLT